VKKVQEGEEIVITYSASNVALERAVMDLHIGVISINSSALEVVCSPPGIGAKKNQKSSETSL
jgi:hypothetical protein